MHPRLAFIQTEGKTIQHTTRLFHLDSLLFSFPCLLSSTAAAVGDEYTIDVTVSNVEGVLDCVPDLLVPTASVNVVVVVVS
jgi:hypothetical protein